MYLPHTGQQVADCLLRWDWRHQWLVWHSRVCALWADAGAYFRESDFQCWSFTLISFSNIGRTTELKFQAFYFLCEALSKVYPQLWLLPERPNLKSLGVPGALRSVLLYCSGKPRTSSSCQSAASRSTAGTLSTASCRWGTLLCRPESTA